MSETMIQVEDLDVTLHEPCQAIVAQNPDDPKSEKSRCCKATARWKAIITHETKPEDLPSSVMFACHRHIGILLEEIEHRIRYAPMKRGKDYDGWTQHDGWVWCEKSKNIHHLAQTCQQQHVPVYTKN
jgi:hypothetical protein